MPREAVIRCYKCYWFVRATFEHKEKDWWEGPCPNCRRLNYLRMPKWPAPTPEPARGNGNGH